LLSAYLEAIKEFKVPAQIPLVITLKESELDIREENHNPMHITGSTTIVLHNNLRYLLNKGDINSPYLRKILGQVKTI
jgi:hypothetical protein